MAQLELQLHNHCVIIVITAHWTEFCTYIWATNLLLNVNIIHFSLTTKLEWFIIHSKSISQKRSPKRGIYHIDLKQIIVHINCLCVCRLVPKYELFFFWLVLLNANDQITKYYFDIVITCSCNVEMSIRGGKIHGVCVENFCKYVIFISTLNNTDGLQKRSYNYFLVATSG